MKAAFLDRDGVLNVDTGYVCRMADVQWVVGAREAVRALHQAGYLVVVVTNQSGIARGYFSESEYHAFTAEYQAAFGERLDAIYHCPHLSPDGEPKEPYRVECDCRKPKNGLIERAIKELDIDREGSFLVGDSERDIEAASRSGIPGYLFQGGDLAQFVESILRGAVRS